MTKETSRLVLRRTDVAKGNKFAIRLDPTIDRHGDLYDLFRDGVVVEVLDIEKLTNSEAPLVTLGVNASAGFVIDRGEKLIAPRTEDEIGRETCITSSPLTDDELAQLSVEQLDARIAALRDACSIAKGQLDRLKRDRSLANDRGYRHPNNDSYHRWVMIVDEIDIVSEQLERIENAIRQATAGKKSLLFKLNKEKRDQFQDRFVRAAKAELPEKMFNKLKKIADNA